jgi:nucleotide-binding universal stress UspA family protein
MYTTILVGTDGSAPAHQAVKVAGELARTFGVDAVHVVAGYRPISSTEMTHFANELPEEFLDTLTSDAPGISIVDDASHALRAMHIEPCAHTVAESGADAILEVADQVGADLIVVGSRGHGVGRRLLRGSVSTKVAHHAECSVLIVHVPHDDEHESS